MRVERRAGARSTRRGGRSNLGIGMVHQHFMLVPVMTVAENIVLGAEPHDGRAARLSRPRRRVRELSERFGLAVDPDARHRGRLGRRAAARRDPARAVPRREDPRARRADGRADRAGGRRTCSRCCGRCAADGTAIVFISHKLDEVLDIADRVTVLRRGKRIDTVPTEGATEAALARLMVGRDVLLRVEKATAQPGEPVLERRGLSARRRPRPAGGPRRLADGARGRDRRPRGRRRQRPERADRGDHRPAARRRRDDPGRTAATSPGASAAGDARGRRRAHRRGPPPARPRPRLHARREPVAARVPHARAVATTGWLSPRKMVQRAKGLLKEFDVRGGEPETRAASLSGGNQQKCVIAREIAERPEGAGRRPADPRPRRRRDRVRPPPPRRRARRGPRDPADLARVRGGPLARRPHPRDLRGRDRRRDAARRPRGGASGSR